MTRVILYLLTLILGTFFANAQQVTGRILDSESNESIPYATIRVGETDLISNDDGYFTLSGENANESALLSVSFIGYAPQKISVSQLQSNNNIIKLSLVSYDIGGVYVSNEKPDPNEVIKLVNENLSENYKSSDYKNTFFSRSSVSFKPKNVEVDIKKSTGLSKSDLQKANNDLRELIAETTKSLKKEYSDILFNLYKNKSEYKLEMLKAVTLKDENSATNFDEIEKKTTDLFLKLMDTTKFYRIKSGIIGSRDTISFSKEYNDRKKDNKKEASDEKKHSRTESKRKEIVSDLTDNSFNKGSDLDFIYNYENYAFTYVETTYLGDDLVFVIDFKPRKKKANFEGRLYINESDYAVIRTDYKLAEGKTLQKLNLKLLLGVKFMANHQTGTIIFKKNPNNNTYHHHYFSEEKGAYFYVNRPIKFIELAKKNKDVVAFNFKVEGTIFTKNEYLNVGTSQISESEFTSFKEKEFEYQILKKYDPNIWKGYNIIEPLEEMKRFEVVE